MSGYQIRSTLVFRFRLAVILWLRKRFSFLRYLDIREDIKRYQNTLSYALSKVDYNVGESIYTIPSDMNLKIRSGTAGYNNKILVSDGNFSLGKNEKVNLRTSAIKNHKLIL